MVNKDDLLTYFYKMCNLRNRQMPVLYFSSFTTIIGTYLHLENWRKISQTKTAPWSLSKIYNN